MRRIDIALWLAATVPAGCAHPAGVTPAPVTVGEPVSADEPRSVTLAGYVFVYPAWWESEPDPGLPATMTSESEVRGFVGSRFGADTGTLDTWRGAMKAWVDWYTRTDTFPVYIAHAFFAGAQYLEAAQAFAEMQALAPSQGEDAEWYASYLAYNAGESYAAAGRLDEARQWYGVATGYADSDDGAVRHYAEVSGERLALDDAELASAVLPARP